MYRSIHMPVKNVGLDEKKIVYVDGKQMSIEDAQNRFGSAGLVGSESSRSLIRILFKASEPMSIPTLATESALGPKRTARILRELSKAGIVTGFPLSGRRLYYALTLFGVKLARDKGMLPAEGKR